jgi:hypothetical protein
MEWPKKSKIKIINIINLLNGFDIIDLKIKLNTLKI